MMMPDPPGRFSTTTFCPSSAVSSLAMMRAYKSTGDPAADQHNSVTGRAGYCCPFAAGTESETAARKTEIRKRRIMPPPPFLSRQAASGGRFDFKFVFFDPGFVERNAKPGTAGQRQAAGIQVELVRDDVVFGLERTDRSEEHTSELQSPKDLVCRLLLEKK